ncbi:MAG TPA: hypothetical protein P5513_04575 [Candidatus Diapherotrites archaeon]|nr:hypothetical protein [Candidatus Diapherotrites archaeon]
MNPSKENLLEACKMLLFNIHMPSVIEFLNENDIDYTGWNDLEMIKWYLENGGYMNESLKEGTWALPKSSQERRNTAFYFIDMIEKIKNEMYPIFGDDILFDKLDEAIERIEELSNTPEEEIEESLNEDVSIPPELTNQYLNIKKQIADKKTKKDQLMRSVNQIDNEINILNKNLIAIESKAAEIQSRKKEELAGKKEEIKTVEVTGKVKEDIDIDKWWKENVSEAMKDELDDEDMYDEYEEDMDIDNSEENEEENDNDDSDYSLTSLEDDYVFALKITDEEKDDIIIAKFYKNEDDDFWKARVVKGEEEPLESMQFDPDMEKDDIIDRLKDIFDDVEEIDIKDYEDLIDNKEKIEDIFYDDILG